MQPFPGPGGPPPAASGSQGTQPAGSGPQGGKWQISTTGGVNPVWRRDGKELFYLSVGKLMSAEIKTAPQFEAGTPRMLFDARVGLAHTGVGPGRHYAVSADGMRFLVIKPKGETTAAAITVVLNWQKAVTSEK